MEFNIDLKTGRVTARNLVRVARSHVCQCGERFEFTLDWPEGMTQQNGNITVSGVQCPNCAKQVVLPPARYWVEEFALVSAPLN